MKEMCKSTLTARRLDPMIYAATQHIVFNFRGSQFKCYNYAVVFMEIFLPAPYHGE